MWFYDIYIKIYERSRDSLKKVTVQLRREMTSRASPSDSPEIAQCLKKKIALWIHRFIQGHPLRTMVGMGGGSIENNHKSSGDNPDAEGNNSTSNL